MDVKKLTGQHVGSYRLSKLLGAGAFGAVYRAVAEVGGQVMPRPAAVKIIPADGPNARRTLRELENILTLRHPHIIESVGHPGEATVIDTDGSRDVVFWFAMELGEFSLAERIAGGPLPEAEVVELARQVGAALLYLHDLLPPRMHRDVKPLNIIRVGGVWKLVDLGLTRPEVTGYSNYEVFATQAYMPPEALDGELPAMRWDVWAFGVTLVEAATGKHLSDGMTPRGWMHLLSGPESVPLPQLPTAIERAARVALVKDPAARGDMQAVLTALETPARVRSSEPVVFDDTPDAAVCHFCGVNTPDPRCSIRVPAWRDEPTPPSLFGGQTTFSQGEVCIPRCARCCEEHKVLEPRRLKWASDENRTVDTAGRERSEPSDDYWVWAFIFVGLLAFFVVPIGIGVALWHSAGGADPSSVTTAIANLSGWSVPAVGHIFSVIFAVLLDVVLITMSVFTIVDGSEVVLVYLAACAAFGIGFQSWGAGAVLLPVTSAVANQIGWSVSTVGVFLPFVIGVLLPVSGCLLLYPAFVAYVSLIRALWRRRDALRNAARDSFRAANPEPILPNGIKPEQDFVSFPFLNTLREQGWTFGRDGMARESGELPTVARGLVGN